MLHSITICLVIEVLGGSAGGLYKRFAAPAALPLPDLAINSIGQVKNHNAIVAFLPK